MSYACSRPAESVVDGPGREREIYIKREGNVVPLVRKPKRH